MNNFDLKKFLTENKLTANSKTLQGIKRKPKALRENQGGNSIVDKVNKYILARANEDGDQIDYQLMSPSDANKDGVVMFYADRSGASIGFYEREEDESDWEDQKNDDFTEVIIEDGKVRFLDEESELSN